jgi:hypothetical protein
MKTIKHLSMFLFVGVCSLLMASCLSDDDNENPFEIDPAYYRSLAGTYTGSAQYVKTVDGKSEVPKIENVTTIISAADSTFRVVGVPAAAFTNNIADEAIKNAIAAAPNPLISGKFIIYSARKGESIAFALGPYDVEFNNVKVGEATHNYKILMDRSSTYGSTDSNVTSVVVPLYMVALYEDDVLKQQFISSSAGIDDNVTILVQGTK